MEPTPFCESALDHGATVVLLLTVGFALASLFGYIAQRLNLSAILGYLVAGFVIGPYSPGFVANVELSEQLAEIGVILMLFGVGMHFKLQDLIYVKNIVVPGALIQTAIATLASMAVVWWVGWSFESGLIMGLSVGVASTVVLVRVLSDNRLLHTPQGHIAVGWLVVEDILTVAFLILLPTIAAFSLGQIPTTTEVAASIGMILLKFTLLVVLMFTWGQRLVGFILTNVARLRTQELFTLTVLALVFLIATGSAFVFGTSIALGAFIAGMVIGRTNVKHQAAANALPLKDMFAIVFFLSVGMLFNPEAIITDPTLFLGILTVILVIKPVVAFLITIAFNYPFKTALAVALALAQIGEFSFILAEEAINLKLLPDEGFDVLVACALVSISLNPLLFQLMDAFEAKVKKATFFKSFKERLQRVESPHPLKTLLVGLGPIGKEVSKYLKKSGFYPIIIEQNIDTVSDQADDKECQVIFGDASHSDILKAAHIEDARLLIITIPDTAKSLEIIEAAKHHNPNIKVLTRIQFFSEKTVMESHQIPYICGEQEVLQAMILSLRHILHQIENEQRSRLR